MDSTGAFAGRTGFDATVKLYLPLTEAIAATNTAAPFAEVAGYFAGPTAIVAVNPAVAVAICTGYGSSTLTVTAPESKRGSCGDYGDNYY